jgi:protein-disulfide isomerase/uncharacterized membrane protein
MHQKAAVTAHYLLRWIALLACLCGFCLSLYLLFEYHSAIANPDYRAPCDISLSVSCTTVARSRFSALFGIPVAAVGVVAFFITAFMVVASWWVELSAALWVVTLGGVAGSGVLFIVSKYLIGVLCPLCCVIYGIWIILALLFVPWVLHHGVRRALGVAARQILSFPAILRRSLKGGVDATLALIGSLLSLSVTLFALSLPSLVDFSGNSNSPVDDFLREEVQRWQVNPIQKIPETKDGEGADFFRGPPDASIRIVEFADFECGACQLIYPRIEELLNQYGDVIRYSLHHYPLDSSCNKYIKRPVHRHACQQALMARCAGIQGKYWESVSAIFRRGIQFGLGRADSFGDSDVREQARSLGLDSEVLLGCMDSQAQRQALERDIDLAQSLGLSGTPSFWVNERRVGRPNAEVIRAIINSVIERDR